MFWSTLAALKAPDPAEEVQQRTPAMPAKILPRPATGRSSAGMRSFLPLTLEQLAREHGSLQTSGLPCWGEGAPDNSDEQCIVGLFGLQINTASFAMYTFSLAVLIQALTLISFSALADYENNRKTLLLTFGFVGAATSMLFIFIFPAGYIIGAILVIIGVICLGSSFVVLNSFLPVLVANDPSVQSSEKQDGEELSNLNPDEDRADWNTWNDEDSLDGMHDHQQNHSPEDGRKEDALKSSSPELQLSTRISSKGVGLGYLAAVFVQILSIILLITLNKTSLAKASGSWPMRFVLLLVGLWWCTFTLVTRRLLRSRPGPPLDTASSPGAARWRVWLRLVGFAWKSLWGTVKVAVKLREVMIFLVAWFLLSDALATVSGTAILFARTELKLSTTGIGLLSITATLSGMAGAFLWPRVSQRFKLKSNQTIIVCIFLFELIPLYGMLAYIPFVKNWGVIGLQQPWEIFPLAIIHGVVGGGLASYCRSFFGLLIPPGSEAAFYALYAATDKGSSFIGPAIVGMLTDATGQVRSGFFVIAILILMPIPLVWMVNAEKGRKEGLAMAETLGRSRAGPTEDAQEAQGLLSRED
ncbi:Major facilitator superfamily domain general substrate transporter [Penicillium argentinense]|uniref:Autophagy-related protein n=1 Tax=Penicillium argentinense TaxID=1131581 RepID=A0A9W9JXD1_9EURO|nr:Major facilitator superfamily domain general substrate transporter [Penicillium argentinense]KAJ5085078.1 Major facilitator superfamily domain general substrate transporter [Penicillium argentinense]